MLNFRKLLFNGISLGIIAMLMQGCAIPEPGAGDRVVENSKQYESRTYQLKEKTHEITLKVEDSIEGKYGKYDFNGFLNGETLSFSHYGNGITIQTFIPTIQGYKFAPRDLQEVEEIEIIEFSRELGTVKLKISMKSLKEG